MITVEHLTKSFTSTANTGSADRADRVVALDDVTLDVTPGAVYAVLGGSGAGKSTLARVIAGAERPDRGSVRVDGADLRALTGRELRAARRQVAVVPGVQTLLRQRTVAGNIALPLEQAGVDGPNRKRRVGELLDLVGLADRAADGVEALPAGQRRRVAVARALATRPGVLIADEPTADADASAASAVLTTLDRARAEYGTTVLLLTADADPVRRVADDAALLRDGRLVASGNLLNLASTGAGAGVGAADGADGALADALLPAVRRPRGVAKEYDHVVDIVLVGFATVGALLPEAARRFDVTLSTIGGGLTRFGDTPVARFLLGVDGEQARAAIGWLGEHGGVLREVVGGPSAVAA